MRRQNASMREVWVAPKRNMDPDMAVFVGWMRRRSAGRRDVLGRHTGVLGTDDKLSGNTADYFCIQPKQQHIYGASAGFNIRAVPDGGAGAGGVPRSSYDMRRRKNDAEGSIHWNDSGGFGDTGA